MDCRSALEILECARPGAHDLQEPEFSDAKTHVETCAACDETFRERQILDRRIGEFVRDVPVPAGLLGRLSAAVGENPLPSEPAASELKNAPAIPPDGVTPNRGPDPAGRRLPMGRRRVQIAAGLAVCLSLVAAILFFHGKPTPTLTIDEVWNTVPLDQAVVDRIVAFDESFDADMPSAGWDSPELGFDVKRGFGATKSGGHQMALVRFSYPGRDKSVLMGMLAIIPKESVKDADQLEKAFASGQGNYTNRESGMYATVSWTEGDLVYVCFMPDTEDARERLIQVLSGVPA